MKKYITALVLAALAVSAAPAQEAGKFTVDGLVKTGFYWQETKREGEDPVPNVKLYNNDDAGSGKGRFRVNIQYEIGDIGFKTRVQWDNFGQNWPEWSYAFGYSNFLDNQLTVSLGKMGSSPWGTGGPEMWKELETSVGVRTEIKPRAIPGLNIGFVLNDFDNNFDSGYKLEDVTFWEILRETVLGVSYDHDYFGVRFAYRLDSDIDKNASNGTENDGDDMIYRVEERVLKNFLPDFQIWANGQYEGIGAADEDRYRFLNWLYAEYAPVAFTAQIRLGYDIIANRQQVHVRPSFYWNFFGGFLSAGSSFSFAQDFGKGKIYQGSPYLYWAVEPKVQVNFGNMTVALVYHYQSEYKYHKDPPIEETNWLNLRFALTF